MSHSKTLVGEKTFIFHNVFNESIWCDAHVKVTISNYDNNDWYYYTIKFNYPEKNSIQANPFRNYKIFFDKGRNKDDVIVKNSLSEKLIEYLLMDYEELSKYCGHSTPEHYKAVVMMQLMLAWD